MILIIFKANINKKYHIQMNLFSVFIKLKQKVLIKIKFMKFYKTSKIKMIVKDIIVQIVRKKAIYKIKIIFILNKLTKKIFQIYN